MSQVLLIALPVDEASSVDWLLWDDESGRAVDRGSLASAGELRQLQPLSRRCATYVVVPGEYVSSSSVVLPAGGSVGLSALPYQLEEQLCGDLAEQHIAHEKLVAKLPCLVAVAARDLMTRWRQLLQAAELRVKALVPDHLLLPDNTVLLSPDRAILHCHGQYASLERENLELWWTLSDGAEPEPSDIEEAPQPLLLEVGESTAWRPPHEEGRACGSVLEALAAHLRPPPLNLLQGDFALRDPWQELRLKARWPAAAAALVLLMHWVLLGAENLRLAREAQALDEAMVAVYREAFPDAQRVVNPRSQMRGQLQSLEQRHGHSPLMPWMERTARAMRDRGEIEISQLQYQLQPQQLRISLRAGSYSAVDQFTEALREQQLQVERGAFGQQDREIRGQLLISGGPQ